MKRITSILLAFVLSVTVLPTAIFATEGSMDNFKQSQSYTEGQFKDVASDVWYAGSVKKAYELGLVKGSSATSFSPSGTMTIAEAITLACRLHSIYTTGTASFEQTDVWYQVYVDYALANQIIDAPYTNYTALATRSEFAKILSKALPKDALSEINTVDDNAILDVSSTAENADAIYLLYRAGILTGSDNYGSFQPNSSITRSEVAAIVTRMADISLRKNISLSRTFYDGEVGKLVLNHIEKSSNGKSIIYLDYTNPKHYSLLIQPLAIEVNARNFRLYDTLWPKNEVAAPNTTTQLSYLLDGDYDECGFDKIRLFDFLGNAYKVNVVGNTKSIDYDTCFSIDSQTLLLDGSTYVKECPAFNKGTPILSEGEVDIIFLGTEKRTIGNVEKNVAHLFIRNKTTLYLLVKNLDLTINGRTYTNTINSFADDVNPTNISAVILPQSQGDVYYAPQDGLTDEIKTIGGKFYIDIYSPNNEFQVLEYTSTVSPVYVGEKVDATAVSLDKTTQSLIVGQTAQLKAIVWPKYAADRNVIFSSSNPAIATVNRNGLITAVKKGTATITATTTNGKTASCTVTVIKASSISAPTPIMYTDNGTVDCSDLFLDKSGFGFYRNGANGICLSWTATNQSGKTMKSFVCYITMYDEAGRLVFDEVSKNATVTYKVAGPVANGTSLVMTNDLIGYSEVCAKVVIDKVYVEYSDGTSETVTYGYSAGNTAYNRYWNNFLHI